MYAVASDAAHSVPSQTYRIHMHVCVPTSWTVISPIVTIPSPEDSNANPSASAASAASSTYVPDAPLRPTQWVTPLPMSMSMAS